MTARPRDDRYLILALRWGRCSEFRAVLQLSEVAEECPLMCFADDAQWLDEASAHVLRGGAGDP